MLSDDEFARLVAEDVKNKSSVEQRNYLKSPGVRDRWRRALYLLIDNLNSQVEQIDKQEKEDKKRYSDLGKAGETLLFEAMQHYDGRRKKIERFRFYVEQRITEVDRLVAMGDKEGESVELSTIAFLQKAIATHRELVNGAAFEPTVADIALWKTLEGKWMFDDIKAGDL